MNERNSPADGGPGGLVEGLDAMASGWLCEGLPDADLPRRAAREIERLCAERDQFRALLVEWESAEYDGADFLRRVRLALHAGQPRLGLPRGGSLLETLLKAAQLLEREASSLRDRHTIRGRWDADEKDARAAYDELRAVAAQLRKAHGYMLPNPLGGPAKVFDACADSIRAGDSLAFAMANYGLAWRPNV